MSDGINVNEALERIIRQSVKRHEVIASNIANVDTPNYKARDISFSQVLGNEIGLATTDSKHIPASAGGNAAGEIREVDSAAWADKNNVEMDQEMAKMTENALRQQAGVTLLTTRKLMFKAALRTG